MIIKGIKDYISERQKEKNARKRIEDFKKKIREWNKKQNENEKKISLVLSRS